MKLSQKIPMGTQDDFNKTQDNKKASKQTNKHPNKQTNKPRNKQSNQQYNF